MSVEVERLYRVSVEGRALGQFTARQLRALRKEVDAVLFPDGNYAEEVLAAVCEVFRISRERIFMRRRMEEIVWPRQVAMFLIYERGIHSLAAIGTMFAMDHGTVMHGRDMVRNRCAVNDECARQVESVRARMKAGTYGTNGTNGTNEIL